MFEEKARAPTTIFRVRMNDLKPGTTCYYTVGSIGADGTDDKTVKS
jgi:hypothetical protein